MLLRVCFSPQNNAQLRKIPLHKYTIKFTSSIGFWTRVPWHRKWWLIHYGTRPHRFFEFNHFVFYNLAKSTSFSKNKPPCTVLKQVLFSFVNFQSWDMVIRVLETSFLVEQLSTLTLNSLMLKRDLNQSMSSNRCGSDHFEDNYKYCLNRIGTSVWNIKHIWCT